FLDEHYSTDANGRFRVPVPATRGILAFRYAPSDGTSVAKYPRGVGANKIAGNKNMGGLISFETIPSYLIASNYQMVAEVAPKEEQQTLAVDFALSVGRELTVQVVDEAGKTVTGLEYYGKDDY